MESLPLALALTRLARAAGLALFIALTLALHAEQARAETASVPSAAVPSAPAQLGDASDRKGPASGLDPGLEQQVRALALGSAGGAAAVPAGVTRVEVVVGQLDPRLHLAPCQKVEPYLPNGARLWGRSRIGLRCTEGSSAWNVYLPITVKAYGRGLVAAIGAPSGSVLSSGDLVQAEVDLAEDTTPALVEPDQALGRTLAQPLKAGQSLRLGHLKPRIWFSAGDTVKVVAVGAGFSLEGEAQALSNGIEGVPARVRTENGRVLTGHAVGNRRVELAL